jgi:hypothetical protein
MRDVHVSIEDYCRGTTGSLEDPEQFTTPVRATIASIQKVNEVLQKDFGQQSRYQKVFAARLAHGDRGAETIEALRYVRNVAALDSPRRRPRALGRPEPPVLRRLSVACPACIRSQRSRAPT